MSLFRFLPLRRASRSARLAILAALLLGVFLRFFQLGRDNLWSDEVSVYQAAIQPTYSSMIDAIQVFAMAMPLDYFVCWIAIHFGSSEFVLRLASAVWGCLALIVYARLALRLIGLRASAVAVLLMALAPPLIHYSQELRFYSPLIFFHGLSVTLLFGALRRPSRERFALYVLVTAIGVYFHPYVLLSTLAGWLSLSPAPGRRLPETRTLAFMTVSTLLLGLIFLPGYLVFHSFVRVQEFSIFEWATIPKLLTGLGLLAAPYTPDTRLFGPFEFLILSGVVGGALAIGRRPSRYRELRALALGAVLQVVLILAADARDKYWFAPRQVVHLIPTVALVASLGLTRFGALLAPRIAIPNARTILTLVILLLISALASPRLGQYYLWPKSNGRSIAAGILARFDPGDRIIVSPRFHRRLYFHYMERLARPDQPIPEMGGDDFISGHQLTGAELLASLPPGAGELLLAVGYAEAARLRELPGFEFETVVAPDVEWGNQTTLLAVRKAEPAPGRDEGSPAPGG